MHRRISVALSLALFACDSDPAPADADTDTSAEVADVADTTSPDSSPDTAEDASPDTTADASPDTTGDTTGDTSSPDIGLPDTTSPDASLADVLLDCHGLDFAITCDKPQADSNGYLACSDYFGNTAGVVEQCSAGPSVDLREGGPPCAGYTHYVGSCIYFLDTPTTRDRCYITHVGATTAEKIDAGRTFWRIACAGQWVESLE